MQVICDHSSQARQTSMVPLFLAVDFCRDESTGFHHFLINEIFLSE